MGAPDRKLALSHTALLKDDPMLEMVPDPDGSANALVPCSLMAAFRAEVDERVGDGDFARREEVALALANEVGECPANCVRVGHPMQGDPHEERHEERV